MTFDDHVQSCLDAIESAGLLRTPRVVSGAQGPTLTIDGKEVVCLCSNNYLGLACHPALADAAAEGVRSVGVGAGASRHISGSSAVHITAENHLADFVGLPRAILFGSGYAANVGAIQSLAGPGDTVFSDELNHASLIDGCRLSRSKVVVYPHRDASALRRLLEEHRGAGGAALVVTESMFSMDGDEAPLSELASISDAHGAGLLVDEAHALGVLGPNGRGLCREHSVEPNLLVGTLGKAFGSSGAFVAGSPPVVRLVENRARSFIFSTAPSPGLSATVPAAIRLVRQADAARDRLRLHASRLRSGLRQLGYCLPNGIGPIIPVHVGPARGAMALSAALLEHRVFVHGIRPPTVPNGTSRLRITPMATHDDEHIDRALAAFASLQKMYQTIIGSDTYS